MGEISGQLSTRTGWRLIPRLPRKFPHNLVAENKDLLAPGCEDQESRNGLAG